ncbi:DUF6282 family protein [Chloroflexota bacterium]
MPGRAWNPLGHEPDLHGGLQPAGEPVKKALQDYMWQKRRGDQRPTKPINYDEAWAYVKRGEGEVMGHYIYEMMYDIYAGIEDEILDGAIDTHLHIYPDYVPRSVDIIQMAIDASKAGYRAICTKDHFFNNVGQCWAAQWVVEDLVRRGELKRACKVFGTHALAFSYHPDQINLIRKYPNLGGVFFPTMTGGGPGRGGPPLPIIDDKGNLMPEVKDCIRRMADNHICVFTGHRSLEEHRAMVRYANEVGAHILLTHSGGEYWGPHLSNCGPVEEAKEMVKLGAYIEVSLHHFIGSAAIWPVSDPPAQTDWLKRMGPERIVMSTDLGQPTTVHPVEGYRVAIRMLMHAGIGKEEMKLMFQKNAAEALYLDEKETTCFTEYPG